MSSRDRARLRRENNGRPTDATERPRHVDRAERSGEPLPNDARQVMESRFAHSFASVRVHSDAPAADETVSLGAAAVTVGSDISFAPGMFAPDTTRGQMLLAHELTHVVQNERHDGTPAQDVSQRGDPAESEASAMAEAVVHGADVRPSATPTAVASPGWTDWIEDKVSGAIDTVGDVASSAGSAIAGGASTAWDAVSTGASDVYGGMKTASNYVHKAENAAMGGIDWLENKASSGLHSAADYVQDVPVLGTLAGGAASGLDQYIQFEGGVLKGATGLIGGLAGAVADPVDTAIAVESLAEHTGIPGMPNPLKMLHAGYNVVTGQESWQDAGNRVFNPIASAKEDMGFMGNVGKAFINPYVESWKAGKPAEAIGHGAFDIATLIATGGSEAAVEGGAVAGRVAGEMGEVTEGMRAVEALGDVSEGANAVKAPTVLEPHPFEIPGGGGELEPIRPAPAELPIPESPGAGLPPSGLALEETFEQKVNRWINEATSDLPKTGEEPLNPSDFGELPKPPAAIEPAVATGTRASPGVLSRAGSWLSETAGGVVDWVKGLFGGGGEAEGGAARQLPPAGETGGARGAAGMTSEEAQSMYQTYRQAGMTHEQAMDEVRRLNQAAAEAPAAGASPNAAGGVRVRDMFGTRGKR